MWKRIAPQLGSQLRTLHVYYYNDRPFQANQFINSHPRCISITHPPTHTRTRTRISRIHKPRRLVLVGEEWQEERGAASGVGGNFQAGELGPRPRRFR